MPRPLNNVFRDTYSGLDAQADFNTAVYDLLTQMLTWFTTLTQQLDSETGLTHVAYEADKDAAITETGPSDPDTGT